MKTRRIVLASILALLPVACGSGVVSVDGTPHEERERDDVAPADAAHDTAVPSDATPEDVVDAGSADVVLDARLRAATPTFSPAPGTFTQSQLVTIATTTPNASIRFTTDGTMPTTSSPVFAQPIPIGSPKTMCAVAIAPGFEASEVAVGFFTVLNKGGPPSPVSFSPASGTFDGGTSVTLSAPTSPSVICYSVDGSQPTCSVVPKVPSAPCTPAPAPSPPPPPPSCTGTASTYVAGTPISIVSPPGGGTVRLRAVVCTESTTSDITEATYVFPAP